MSVYPVKTTIFNPILTKLLGIIHPTKKDFRLYNMIWLRLIFRLDLYLAPYVLMFVTLTVKWSSSQRAFLLSW